MVFAKKRDDIIFTRYGGAYGSFLTEGNPLFLFRSLPDSYVAEKAFHAYRLVTGKTLNANVGRAAPWFNKPGGSILVQLQDDTIESLMERGILEEVVIFS